MVSLRPVLPSIPLFPNETVRGTCKPYPEVKNNKQTPLSASANDQVMIGFGFASHWCRG